MMLKYAAPCSSSSPPASPQLKAGSRGSPATAPSSCTHPPRALIVHIHSSIVPPIYGVHRALLGPLGRRRLCPLFGRALFGCALFGCEPAPPTGPQVPRLGQNLYSLCSSLP